MKNISAKGVWYGLLSMLLLLPWSLVGALDIIFYQDKFECSGIGFAYRGVGPNVCCIAFAEDYAGSVAVRNATRSFQASRFFRNGKCTTLVGSAKGNTCLVGGGFSRAFWYKAPPTSSHLNVSKTCESQMTPTGVVFTEDGTQGNWILTTSEAAEMYSKMQKISDAEKANWLQSHGASYTHL